MTPKRKYTVEGESQRIVIVAPRFVPGRTYGAETYLFSLLDEFNRQSDDVEYVILVNTATAALVSARYKRLKVMAVKVPQVNYAAYAWEQLVLPRLLRRARPTLLFFPFNIMPAVRIPSVLMVHDMVNDYYLREHPAFMPLLFRSRQKAIHSSLTHASAVVTPTEAVAGEIRVLLPRFEAPTFPIHEAAFPAEPNTRRPSALPGHVEQFVLQSGHHSPHKNLALGIQALRVLKDRMPQVYARSFVVMTAPTSEVGDLQELARLENVAERIVFLGRVAADELEWLVQNAAALGFPSRYEGFGLGVVEGIDRGRVVLAADTPVFREVARGHAYLFNPESAEEYAGLIADAVLGRLRPPPSGAIDWTWTHHVAELTSVFQKVEHMMRDGETR